MTAWAWFALLLGFFMIAIARADETLEVSDNYVPMPKENLGIFVSNFMLPLPVLTEQAGIESFESETSSEELETADDKSSVSSIEEVFTTNSDAMPAVTVEQGITTTTSSSSLSPTTPSKHVSVIVITRTIGRTAQETASATSAPPAPAAVVTTTSPLQSSAAPAQTVPASSDWRVEMLNSLNSIRASVGKPPLAISPGLNQVSQAHSAYQLALGRMTHNDATTLGSRVSSVDIKWSGISENVAAGQTSVAQVMQAWKNSPGHYANMIGDYDIAGFGQSGNYWTQDFVNIATGSSVSVNNAQFINNSASLQAEPSQTPIKVQAQQDDWRQEMLTLLNNLRAKVGKKALVLNSNMNKLAQDHSDYQASIKTMTHNDTKPLGDRVKAYGIRWGGIAENVVYNTKTVSQAIQAWANSPGHYRNMIGDYEIVGFGETNLYWTQNFASYL
ncbi:hypothetical protein GGI05_000152 [Coemansia sp. RSA 2603]|nr:hypothetical protein GGI05_000152 [Coemansia sp. RSA 2603]